MEMTESRTEGERDQTGSARAADSPAALSISGSSTGSRHVLALRGELDMATVADLYAAVSRLAPIAREIVLDLSQLTFLDSSGLYLVLRLRDLCKRNRCRLSLTSVGPQVRRVFEITGLIEPMREQGLLAD
jgi:anti-sigma B factor antagonist